MADEFEENNEEPCYVISVAARMVGMHAQTLRYYERMGVLKPSRSHGRIRLYSSADVSRLRQIHRLIDDLGVNLAGAEVILRMNQHIQEMNEELALLRRELQQLRDRRLLAPLEPPQRERGEKNDNLKQAAELGVAESFLLAYNSRNRGSVDCPIRSATSEPDVTCREMQPQMSSGLGVTAAYYDHKAAKGLWDMMRGLERRATGVVADLSSSQMPGETVDRTRKPSSSKPQPAAGRQVGADYDSPCVLLVHIDGPVTTAADFEE